MKRKTLTTTDLLLAPTEGFGYLGHPVRTPSFWAQEGAADPYSVAQAQDEAVVEACNKAKLTPEQFAAFVDSKAGRLMGDDLTKGFPFDAKRNKMIAGYIAYFLRGAA